jgi:ribosomal-protein-alanine N-acetyltransferase
LTVFTTQRLCIRHITREDAEDLSQVLSDPHVMKYSTQGVHSQIQISEYIANCQRQYALNGYGHWAIYNRVSGEFIGICGLNKHQVDAESLIHINYRLVKRHQGNGYATEATIGLLTLAKKTYHFQAVFALIDSENKPSVRLVARTGFEYLKSTDFYGFAIDVYKVSL